jgi:DNA-binding MarR family transcriptional regulator
MTTLLDECAHPLLETTPQIVRSVRHEMRSRRSSDLSVPQFRALSFVHTNEQPSLSELADHLGLTLASTSKIADVLVRKNLLIRAQSPEDRRRLTLNLTKQGEAIYQISRAGTQAHLSKLLSRLSPEELSVIKQAFELMQPIFASKTRP